MIKLTFWHIAILLVMGAGFYFLITGYDAGLPLYESVDERHNLDEVYILRGLKDAPLWKPGYPPGILYLNYGAQLLAEATTGQSAWDQACLVIQNVRVTGIVVNLITALLIALTARRLVGDAAGILAALGWLVAPRVLAQAQFGFPQVYEALLYMLALYLAIRALETRQPRDALLSVLAGLGAVIFKYVTFPALGLGVGAALWNLRTDRRRWLRVLLVQVVFIVLTAAALLAFSGMGSLAGSGHVETNQFFSEGLADLFNFDTQRYAFENAAGQVGLTLTALTLLVIVGTAASWPRAAIWQRLGWIGTIGLGFLHVFLLAAYLFHQDGIDRNILSSSGLVAVMVSVAVMSIAGWLAERLRRPALQYVFAGVFALVWLIPQVIGAWDWVHYRSLPVTYAALVDWADEILPQETLLVNDNRPFIRDWNCANHIPRVTIWEQDITDQPISAWLEQDVYYAVLTQSQVETLSRTPAGQDYLKQMTLLKQFPPPGEEDQWRTWRRGDEANVAVYQLWQNNPETETDIVFGEKIQLIGRDMDTRNAEPGGTIDLQFYWQPLQQPDADYNIFLHLTPVETPEKILAQYDGPPAHSPLRTTSTWNEPGETFISDDIELQIPENVVPGVYRLRFGLYNWRTGECLQTDTGHDSVSIPIYIP
jgi:hypothetical protein